MAVEISPYQAPDAFAALVSDFHERKVVVSTEGVSGSI
jgi:hypothetical protein